MSNYPVIRPYDAPTLRRPRRTKSSIPASLAACAAIALALGVMGYRGMERDLHSLADSRLAEDTLAMERVVRVANAEDRAEKRLADADWLATMGDCLRIDGCPEAVAAVKGRKR